MPLTVLQLAMLCQLLSFDPPCEASEGYITAGTLAREALMHPACGPLTPEEQQTLRQIGNTRVLKELRLMGYQNDNRATGFVGFAFEGESFVILGFRGSESTLSCAPNNIDWLDNLRAPFEGSIQYSFVRAFARRYGGSSKKPVLFIGHSKGGHNALYACALCARREDRCVCFGAQGFASRQLTQTQRTILRTQAVNYVQYRDVVGALLYHPEKRIFAAGTGNGNPHALFSTAYDMKGDPVSAKRSALSFAAEWVSRIALRAAGRNEPPENALGAAQG